MWSSHAGILFLAGSLGVHYDLYELVLVFNANQGTLTHGEGVLLTYSLR
jgi:hypothetical protein